MKRLIELSINGETCELAVEPNATLADGARMGTIDADSLPEGALPVPPADEEAARTAARIHPDREVVPVPALEIVKGGGGIHCITQQEPLTPGKRGVS